MLVGHGLRARAQNHLVGVAAHAAPGANGIRRSLLPARPGAVWPVSMRCNRRPDMYTPDSAEFNSDNAWAQNFDDGNQDNWNKNNDLAVRAVRK